VNPFPDIWGIQVILQGISTGQLLERIRDLRTQVTGFTQRIVPASPPEIPHSKWPISEHWVPDFKIPNKIQKPWISGAKVSALPPPEPPEFLIAANKSQSEGKPSAWAKSRLVESGLSLTGELKNWQVRAESGSGDIATILDPEEFRAVVQIADAALRLIPSFPNEPEQLEPLALALETILQPLRLKIASWHHVAKEFADLGQMVQNAKATTDSGQKSALAATLVRFSQKTGRLGLWLLPWDKLEPSERMTLAEAWLASTAAFRGGVWEMHEAAFAALQGKAPPIPPRWGSWLADLENRNKPTGPWGFCQTMENGTGESHPMAGEWVPVEHPGLGILLLMDNADKGHNCRALSLGSTYCTDKSGTAIVVTPQDMSHIQDLPPDKLRTLLARMLLGGQRS